MLKERTTNYKMIKSLFLIMVSLLMNSKVQVIKFQTQRTTISLNFKIKLIRMNRYTKIKQRIQNYSSQSQVYKSKRTARKITQLSHLIIMFKNLFKSALIYRR